jgi:hypothetical protein
MFKERISRSDLDGTVAVTGNRTANPHAVAVAGEMSRFPGCRPREGDGF